MKWRTITLEIIKRIITITIALLLVFTFGHSEIPSLARGLTQAAYAANPASAPDLIISGIIWSPVNPSIGDTVTFTINIKNQGNDRSGASRVAYYIDDGYLNSDSINPIDPGAIVTNAITWTAKAGSHTIKAVADSDNEVTESEETNNEKTNVFSTLAPDLIIQNITWSPENPSEGDTVTFSATLKNGGNSRASFSNVDFYIDDSSRGYQDVQAIDAGAIATKTFTWIAQAGPHDIRAVADSSNQIAESDETNNEKSIIFSTQAPDLIIQNITWSPENPSKKDDVTFTITIKNQGTGTADYSHIAYYINDDLFNSDSVNPIDPGATANKTFNWKATAGSNSIKIVADSNTWVTESDETNNEKVITFSTLAPDLIIQDIAWSPTNASTGDTVTFTVTIKNQGTGRADYSRVSCYFSGSATGYQDVQTIDADATVTKTFTWIAEAGSRVIKAVADSNENVIENDESNNDKKITFSTLTPDLIVQNIAWSPADASEGDTVTFTITIENQGSGRADSSYVAYYINDVYLNSNFVNPVDPGSSTNSTFTWKALTGPHVIKALADSNMLVTESDESNNDKKITFSTPAPDLIIEKISWLPTNASVGETATFTVTIKNQGSDRAGASRVVYYIDGSSIGYHDIQELETSATVTKTFPWTTEAGSHSITAIADSSSQVNEHDESNNLRTATLPPPDLIIQNATWSPASASVGDTVTFTVTIENQGNGRADSFRIAHYIDDSSIGHHDIQEVDAGSTTTETFTWKAEAGSHTIKIVADSANYITESNETNNGETIAFSTLTPDLVIQDIAWSLTDPSKKKSKDVTFTITIKNQGNGRADSSRITHYIDDSSIGYHDIQEIDAGATATETFTWTTEADSHTLKVLADSNTFVSESNETNNEKTVTFSTLTPDLVIQDITWSPASASIDDTVTFTVTIENQGTGRSDSFRITHYIDDSSIGHHDIQELDAGSTTTETFTWKAEAGSHTIKVVADTNEAIIESDKTNNTKLHTLSLPAIGEDTGNPAEKQALAQSPEKETSGDLWWWIYIVAAIFAVTAVIAIIRSYQKS